MGATHNHFYNTAIDRNGYTLLIIIVGDSYQFHFSSCFFLPFFLLRAALSADLHSFKEIKKNGIRVHQLASTRSPNPIFVLISTTWKRQQNTQNNQFDKWKSDFENTSLFGIIVENNLFFHQFGQFGDSLWVWSFVHWFLFAYLMCLHFIDLCHLFFYFNLSFRVFWRLWMALAWL